MSHTIQAPHYRPQQGMLRHLNPSATINSAESFSPRYSQIFDLGVSVSATSKRLTSATRIMPIDIDAATSAIRALGFDEIHGDGWSTWVEATKAALKRPAANSRSAASATARLRVERLTTIQATLGLSTQDFSLVLGLSRPGLYKWLNASKDVELQKASRERLIVVERIAKQWRERSSLPLRSVAHEPLLGGQTVLSMMIAQTIDEVAVVSTFDEIVAKLQGKPKSRSQRLAEAGFTRRPSARALPADE
ncbi:MAG: hypothetical protein WAT33_15775 [Giesbergeria sp.]